MKVYDVLLLVFSLMCASSLAADKIENNNNQYFTIYLDADRSRHFSSANSIEMGIKTAFHQVNNRIQNYQVKFVTMDHRGNSTRSKLNMKKAFDDSQALLVMSGMHSPPLIKNREFINNNQMLTLVPWAAGGPITRYPAKENWIFRLSIDDTKAGIKIAQFAITEKKCHSPALLLEQTPWGDSNRSTLLTAIQDMKKKEPSIIWYNWGISEAAMRIKLRAINDKGADCIIFVGNANDGTTLVKSKLTLEKNLRLPIYSHWGITGGKFHKTITAEERKQVPLYFIQTCFSFVSSKPTPFSEKVFLQAQKIYPELSQKKSLLAPTGFIHAHDLGVILIQALSQFKLTDDMKSNRKKLRQALENIEKPVQGLIKIYDKPFSQFTVKNDAAHEALNINDFCMAKYGVDDEIVLL